MTVRTAEPIPAAATPGRVRAAVLTWGMGAVYSAITILIGFFATPILLKLLSAERVGAARVVGEWMGYLMLADLGLMSAFGVLMVRARKGGPSEVASVTRLGLRVMSIIALVIAPAALALGWFMPQLVKIDPALVWELRVAAIIGAIAMVLVPLSVFRSVLETAQRGYLVNAALLMQSLTVTGLSLLLAWRGWGIVGLSVATVVGSVVYLVMTVRWGLRLLGNIAHVPPARIPIRELWGLSWPLAAAGAGNRLNLMTDAIVVGYFLGSTPVAVLFLTQRLILLVAGQVNSLGNASWAAMSELLNTGQREILESRVAELVRLIVGVGIVIVGTVTAYTSSFVRLWVGGDMYGGDLLAALTAASAITFGFLRLFIWIIDMQGDARQRVLVSSIGAILNLILSLIFVKWIGLAGVALGTLLAYLVTDAWYAPWLAHRRYGISVRTVALAAARGMALGLPWAAGAWLLARSHAAPEGWARFGVEAGMVLGLGMVYCWLAVLSVSDRHEWRKRFSRLRKTGVSP